MFLGEGRALCLEGMGRFEGFKEGSRVRKQRVRQGAVSCDPGEAGRPDHISLVEF